MTKDELITALEKATGPDRKIDRAIWYEWQDEMTGDPVHSPAYTASIDAALTLVGWVGRCEFGQYDEGDKWWAYLHFSRNGKECLGDVQSYANAPLAILGAYFAALLARIDGDEA